jgi:hypothetical protein
MSDWESIFKRWAEGPGKTEEEKCERAVEAIRKAIAADPKLSSMNVVTFPQGSYRNRTNIRIESDVDVCVCCKAVFFAQYPTGTTRETFGNSPASYTYSEFKNDVENALVQRFGRASVKRGEKAFDIKNNTYRVDADAVPTFEHRRYAGDGTYLSGVELRPDDAKPPSIINWPEQAYQNGVRKHLNTSRRYKKVIRIFKHLRNEMQNANISASQNIASFLIECLVWNVPNDYFGNTLLTTDVRNSLAYLITQMDSEDKCSEWGEVSELKYLFRTSQPWTRQQAYDFVIACWRFLGFSA